MWSRKLGREWRMTHGTRTAAFLATDIMAESLGVQQTPDLNFRGEDSDSDLEDNVEAN